MTDHVRLFTAERVEDASSVVDVGRNRVRPFDGRRSLSPLLVPRDVVFFRQFLGQIAQVVEAEAGAAVQEQNRRSVAGAKASDQRFVISRDELGPFHRAPILSRAGGEHEVRSCNPGTKDGCTTWPPGLRQ